MEQSQDSKQDEQCVSGDDTIISCNNIAAQSQSNDDPDPDTDPNPDPNPIPIPDELTLCHMPPGNPENSQTITVPISAVPAHLAHGDTIGPCPDS
ncbi:MAG: hypothetical protein P0116_15815 [Candidatus Nitrosocosmicus sp.]|nr:hypothetical protein [Candidatus Nitrosocosmicus sp.]